MLLPSLSSIDAPVSGAVDTSRIPHATRHDVAAARNGVEGGIVAPALELVDVDLPSQRRVQ